MSRTGNRTIKGKPLPAFKEQAVGEKKKKSQLLNLRKKLIEENIRTRFLPLHPKSDLAS